MPYCFVIVLNLFCRPRYFQMIFPHLGVIKTLLDCGAPVNARNDGGNTPLHIASLPTNYTEWVLISIDY